MTHSAIRLFNEKFDEIVESEFIKKIARTGVSFKKSGEFLESEIKGPNKNEIKTMLLDLRFLIQDNEPSSLRNLSRIYPNLKVNPELKNNFLAARNSINNYLGSKSPMHINGKNLSNRHIFDVFIYGGFAHSTKKKIFDNWKNSFLLYPFLVVDFFSILRVVLSNLAYIKEINKQVLNELNKVNKNG